MSKWNPKQRERVKALTNGKCGYCGEDLQPVFHVDHVRSRFLHQYHGEGRPDREENLMAACPSCNILKNSGTVDQFRELVAGFNRTLLRDPRYRCLTRMSRVQASNEPVVFYFETLTNA